MDTSSRGMERRSFLVLGVPACAAMCAGLCGLAGAAVVSQEPAQGAPPAARHPFDEEVPKKFTYLELQREKLIGSIGLSKYLTRTLGRDKTLELLRGRSEEKARNAAPDAAKLVGGNDFAALKKLMSPEQYKGLLVMEVIENTERVYQLKITDCTWARIWREANAAEEGYALICHGDFAVVSELNPKFELLRDKTLMQGHSYCNHRVQVKA